MRIIGLDVHRSFAVAVFLDGNQMRQGGRVELTRDAVIAFGQQLRRDDEVVIEATVNTASIARLLEPFVHRVVIANPLQVRAIAHAKIKTDKIDAGVLAKLHASGFLPEVWMPDEATETLRRLVAQRTQIVQQMTRIKNRLHSILHANLIPPFAGELFSVAGRAQHGRITKQGRSHARGMLVEAAWAAARAPGPLRAFFLRIQSRRGKQVAAVATAPKLAVLVWHLLTKGEDYAWARPAGSGAI